MYSVVLIVPAALKPQADALADALGYGPNSYSVPLSAGGTEPVTHYGLHTWADEAFLAMLAGAEAGQMPEGLDYPADDFAAVTAALIPSVRDSMDGHFAEVVASNSLVAVGSASELRV